MLYHKATSDIPQLFFRLLKVTRQSKCEKDMEWGTIVYEIEFNRGFFEYEYEVDARSGKILTSEKSWDW